MDSSQLLKLPYLEIENVEEGDGQYSIRIKSKKEAPYCCLLRDIVRNGTKEVMYRDLPMHGKWVSLWADRQRWKCKNCEKTLYQEIPGMNETHMMTNRLVAYIQQNATSRTFASLAQEIGLNETTIRKIFRAYATAEIAKVKPVTPVWLGLDEMYLLQKFRGVVTNVKDRTIVDLLEKRDLATVTRYLSQLEGKEKIELVAMDMWGSYRTAVRRVLPQAKIVVDKFHVVRMANEAIDRIRKDHRSALSRRQRLQLKDDRWMLLTNPDKLPANKVMILETWLLNYPLIREGYEAKEGFRAVWECSSAAEAKERYDEWEKTLPDSVRPAFKDLTTAMKNWREEIFAFFDWRVTNAYTEALNGLAKIINRLGRGYSFETLRAKVLLSHRHIKREKPTFKRVAPPPRSYGLATILSPNAEELGRVLGIDISTLTQELLALPDPREINREKR